MGAERQAVEDKAKPQGQIKDAGHKQEAQLQRASSVAPVLALQRTVGNRAAGHIIRSGDHAVPGRPLTRMAPGALQRDPVPAPPSQPPAASSAEPPAAGPPSFDPAAVDVAAMSNETLNLETMRVDTWLSGQPAASPATSADYPAYQTLRDRLRGERTSRVRLGHVWMAQPLRSTPAALYMVTPGTGGRANIVAVDVTRASGVPDQTPAGPIMTEAQYWAYLASHNITPMDQATYQRDYAARYEGAAPGSQGQAHDRDPNGQSAGGPGGPGGRPAPVSPIVAMYLPAAAAGGPPSSMTLHHGTTQSGYEGFAGGIDLNRLQGGHQDFSRGLYTSTDPEVASHSASQRALQRGEGGLQHVLQWELDPTLVDIVDIRPGGTHRALWEQFLREPPPMAAPGQPLAGRPGFGTNQEYLESFGIEQRGIVFEQFLRRNGLQNADVIMGDLGGPATSGALALPNRVSDQVVIRSQKAVDLLNAQMRGEPPGGGQGRAGGTGGTGGPGGPGGPGRPGSARTVGLGAAAGGVIAVLTTAGWMYFDAADHPEWAQELAATGGQGSLAGATQAGIERAILSGGGRVAPGMAQSTLGRVARGGGAGVVASGLEIYSMTQEPFSHSPAEVGVRSGRAAAIGAVSAEVGTAVGATAAAGVSALAVMFGTAAEGAAAGSVVPGWGTAIGFIVGLAAGAATYYLLDQALPGGRDSWHPPAEQQ